MQKIKRKLAVINNAGFHFQIFAFSDFQIIFFY